MAAARTLGPDSGPGLRAQPPGPDFGRGLQARVVPRVRRSSVPRRPAPASCTCGRGRCHSAWPGSSPGAGEGQLHAAVRRLRLHGSPLISTAARIPCRACLSLSPNPPSPPLAPHPPNHPRRPTPTAGGPAAVARAYASAPPSRSAWARQQGRAGRRAPQFSAPSPKRHDGSERVPRTVGHDGSGAEKSARTDATVRRGRREQPLPRHRPIAAVHYARAMRA